MKLSSYQEAIMDFIINGEGSAIVSAVPGSGKTTTLLEAASRVTGFAIFLAFNVHIAKTLEERLKALGSSMSARTIHSLGYRAFGKFCRNLPKMDAKKYFKMCREWLELQAGDDKEKKKDSYRKAKLMDDCISDLMLNLYGTEYAEPLDENAHLFYELTQDQFQYCISLIKQFTNSSYWARPDAIATFDEQIYIPIKFNIDVTKYDWIFVDECQDLNPAQLRLVMMHRHEHTRMLLVGDPLQSIMGFAGADTQGMEKAKAELNATVLPLSISYRCPRSHVEMARQYSPTIESSETAKEGTIIYGTTSLVYSIVKPGDMILCRFTAPLVSTCFRLIAQGKSARVRGRNIGKSITTHIKKIEKARDNFPTFLEDLDAYRVRTIQGFINRKEEDKVEAFQDQLESILAVYDSGDFYSYDSLVSAIENLFSDEDSSITLSTIHRAKGLESDRVIILLPEALEYVKDYEVGNSEAEQQAKNVALVALTRSKDTMYLLKGEKVV